MQKTPEVPAGVAPKRFCRLPEVEQRLGLKKSTIYAMQARGEFPKSVRLTGNRAVAWHAEDIDRFIESRTEVGA